jgi:hypothetical protein
MEPVGFSPDPGRPDSVTHETPPPAGIKLCGGVHQAARVEALSGFRTRGGAVDQTSPPLART